MSSMTFGQKPFQKRPPDKGSFPLDHEGACRDFMMKYMGCLKNNQMNNFTCREESKAYLECRMSKNLMTREDWKKLGYSDLDVQEKTSG